MVDVLVDATHNTGFDVLYLAVRSWTRAFCRAAYRASHGWQDEMHSSTGFCSMWSAEVGSRANMLRQLAAPGGNLWWQWHFPWIPCQVPRESGDAAWKRVHEAIDRKRFNPLLDATPAHLQPLKDAALGNGGGPTCPVCLQEDLDVKQSRSPNVSGLQSGYRGRMRTRPLLRLFTYVCRNRELTTDRTSWFDITDARCQRIVVPVVDAGVRSRTRPSFSVVPDPHQEQTTIPRQ